VIDFWVSIGSTYSYLTVMRLKSVEEASGISFRWRPFSVRAIMIEQKNIPFVGKPVKMAYMWRDIERRARNYGFEPKLPAPYPLAEFDLANRVAILAASEGWCPDYAVSAYRGWFHSGQEPGSEAGLSRALEEVGQEKDCALERARSPEIGERYLSATEEAKALGVFGSPTFVVDGEVFWGDDRLEDALRWHERRGAARA
jgi:2-hydroxychromene-2-carboxylate isomerase